MKIQKANAGHLTNFEVLDLLRSKGATKDPTRVMSLLTTSEFKVYDYLEASAARDQTREGIDKFLEKSKEYQLAKAEVMNIVNIRPSSAVELAPLIESDERGWDEDKLQEVTELIAEVLPPPPNLDQNRPDEEAAEDDSAQVDDEDKAAEDDSTQVDDEDKAAEDDSAQVDDEGEATEDDSAKVGDEDIAKEMDTS